MRNGLKGERRGFTLAELTIVIAVIALLAAVLIPTFTSIIKEAKIKTARIAAAEELSYYLVDQIAAADMSGDYIITYDGYAFLADDGKFKDEGYYDLSSGKHDGDEISLTCDSTYTKITITLVTNSSITATETKDENEKIKVEVNNNSKVVITVNAQFSSDSKGNDTGYYCAISSISEGEGEIPENDDGAYSYFHKDTAIYEIKYS